MTAPGGSSLLRSEQWGETAVVRPEPAVADTAGVFGRFRTTLLFFLVFGVLWPTWLVWSIEPGPRSSYFAYAVQVLLLGYVTFRVALVFGAGRPDWLQVSFWGFIYTWFGIAPLVQLVAGRTPLRQAIDPGVAAGQALLVLLGVVVYDLGRSLAARRPRTTRSSTRVLVPSRVAVLTVVALLSTPILVQLSGGTEAVFSSRQARTSALVAAGYYSSTSKSTGAFISAAASVLPFVALLSLVVLRLQKHPAVRSALLFWITFTGLVVANLLLNNPISSSRFWVLTVLLSFVFVLRAFQSKSGVRLVLLSFLLASQIVFPYLDAFRYERVRVRQESIAYFMTYKLDYDAMAQVGNAIRFVAEYGHTGGRQLLGAVLFWVPRRWWPDKPIDTGTMLAQFAHYPNQNLSGPFWAEFYLDFGLVGLVLGFGALGYFSRTAGRRYLVQLTAAPRWRGAVVVVVPVFAMYQVLILRGSLLQSMGRLAVLVVVWFLLTRRVAVELGASDDR